VSVMWVICVSVVCVSVMCVNAKKKGYVAILRFCKGVRLLGKTG
jgi:hypothetical protein